jgi:hypothetical protein
MVLHGVPTIKPPVATSAGSSLPAIFLHASSRGLQASIGDATPIGSQGNRAIQQNKREQDSGFVERIAAATWAFVRAAAALRLR